MRMSLNINSLRKRQTVCFSLARGDQARHRLFARDEMPRRPNSTARVASSWLPFGVSREKSYNGVAILTKTEPHKSVPHFG